MTAFHSNSSLAGSTYNNNTHNTNNNQASFRSSSFRLNNNNNNETNNNTIRSIPVTVVTNPTTTTPQSPPLEGGQANFNTSSQHLNNSSTSSGRYSDLSNLSLIYLKKGLSGSSSFHNKVNLYSNNQLSDISIDPDPDSQNSASPFGQYHHSQTMSHLNFHHSSNQNHQASVENLLTTIGSRRPVSANLNAANINRFIRPKLAVNASSTSTCNLANAGIAQSVSSGGSSIGGGILKPPLPQSRSTFSKSLIF